MARRGRGDSTRAGQAAAGWLFIAPVLVILGLFLALPVIMAAWVSVSDWTGRGSPFAGDVEFVGADNYSALLTGGGLTTENFGTALRNNAWYVLLVVPIQTALALALAVLVGKRAVRGRGFFRTAFYFPSVTSSVAITVVFLFLFTASGRGELGAAPSSSIEGPNWFNDPRGVVHVLLGAVGVDQAPGLPRPTPTCWASRCGTGWPGRASRCRSSSSWRSSPRPGPSCCCSSRRCRTSRSRSTRRR